MHASTTQYVSSHKLVQIYYCFSFTLLEEYSQVLCSGVDDLSRDLLSRSPLPRVPVGSSPRVFLGVVVFADWVFVEEFPVSIAFSLCRFTCSYSSKSDIFRVILLSLWLNMASCTGRYAYMDD